MLGIDSSSGLCVPHLDMKNTRPESMVAIHCWEAEYIKAAMPWTRTYKSRSPVKRGGSRITSNDAGSCSARNLVLIMGENER